MLMGILFNEDTPNALIKLIKPSFVKGGDYSETYLRATDLFGLKNTELKIIPLKTNYSSTRLIKKLLSSSIKTFLAKPVNLF